MRIKTLSFILLAVFVASCSSNKRAKEAPLPNMYSTLDALAAAVVGAIQDSSFEKLQALCLTEQEYRNVVWANLDSSETSQPAMTVERAWSWVVRDTEKAGKRYVSEYGNRELQLTNVGPVKNVKTYPAMAVHRGLRIAVSVDGTEPEEWRLLNVILEYKGWFKVITLND